MLLPGYSQISRLGVGARSVIYKVIRDSTGQVFALKHIERRDAQDDRFIEQAENEYKVCHPIHHPLLRRCLEIRRVRHWFQTRALLILMEYVEGETLEQKQPEGLLETIDLFHKVAEGLQAFHEAGHVHADMKPNNILLTRDNNVKLIDFGQSCRIGHIKSRIQGTPDYIAPEQAHRRPIDRRTDVFNVGATLYWTVTGRAYPTVLPSQSGTRGMDIATPKDATPPHELNPELPMSLSKLIMDCCKTKPKDRPAGMNELRARLTVVRHILERENQTDSGGSSAKWESRDEPTTG